MAFSLGGLQGAGSNAFGGNPQTNNGVQNLTGPDLEEIQTEAVGFLALAGESKIRLLQAPWPTDALPPSTSSLLSIASRKCLLAAGGPDSLVIASTDSVRQAFSAEGTASSDVKPFNPQLTIPLGMRLSQVAFSADEEYLVASAETGGGLAVYETNSIMQGSPQTAFEIPTDGAALRALVPNPALETAELFAVITTNGQLMMANLKERKFISGSNGYVLKDGVSCASWSTKGKQLIAGLGNGAGFQMTPDGTGKADIPRPDALEGDQHVSSISWLENNVFLVVHTPSSFDSDTIPTSTFHIITRTLKPTLTHTFQKLPDPCSPFGVNRSPPHQFLLRLKDFRPNLQDLLVVSSTVSSDIGLFTRSSSALTSDVPAEKITNVFTTTSMAEDSRRATLPMTEDMSDTSTIGLAFDLSAKENAIRPLRGEEMDTSPTPLPALIDLNHEGVLAAWWIVYSESIRQGTGYHGLVAVGEGQQQQQVQVLSKPQTTPQASPFGSTIQPQKATFGQPALGAPSTSTAFGAPSGLGNRQSPWSSSGGTAAAQTSGAAFGKPAFGSSTPLGGAPQGAAFGATGGMGIRQSPWGTPAATLSPSPTASSFGQASIPGMKQTSVFSGGPSGGILSSTTSTATPATASGGFGSYAASGGFAAASAVGNAFGKGGNFGNDTTSSNAGAVFGTQKPANSGQESGVFGSGPSGFTMNSTFKGDGSSTDDAPRSDSGAGGGLFGSAFGDALGDTQKRTSTTPPARKTELKAETNGSEKTPHGEQQQAQIESTTPASTPVPRKSQIPATGAPATGGMFGTQAQSNITPAAVQTSEPVEASASTTDQSPATAPPVSGGLFGTQAQSKVTPAAVQTSLPATTWSFDQLQKTSDSGQPSSRNSEVATSLGSLPPSPKIKPDPGSDAESTSGVDGSIPEIPVQSTTATKAASAPTDSKQSLDGVPSSTPDHTYEDAPLPPDFVPAKGATGRSTEAEPALPTDDEDDGLFEEGSGEDVAQDISPTTDPGQSPKITPESSFGASFDPSPCGGLFTKVPRQPQQQVSKPLFGEISNISAPVFPPPSKIQESPRSPSPVRGIIHQAILRPDNARSISAPNTATMSGGVLPGIKKTHIPSGAALAEAKSKRQPSGLQPSRPKPTVEERREQERKVFAELNAKKQAEEEQELTDNEDERVREELASDVEGTLILEPFLAHQDYIGHINKPGIAGQIEKVYRDINSMIDTLGLNARSLTAFVKGHRENYKRRKPTRDDLENDDWCLIEVEDLINVEKSLGDQLEKGCVKDPHSKLEQCHAVSHDLVKTRAKLTDIRKVVDAHKYPEREDHHILQLSAEQAAQQSDIRRAFLNVQKLLAEAEEGITLLTAKLASSDDSNPGKVGKNGISRPAAPTVDAVLSTITKMTNMAEKRSGDIDVLENQMRRIRLGSVNSNRGDDSREASPFVTPPSSRKMLAGPSHLGASTASASETPWKKMSEITDEDVQRFRAKRERKREMQRLVAESLKRIGPRVRGVDDV